MRVGMIHYAGPPSLGGVELTIFHHARVLTELGHPVTVVAGVGEAVQPGVTFIKEPLAGSRGGVIDQANVQLNAGQVPVNFGHWVEQTRAALLRHFDDCDVVIGHNLFTLHKNQILTAAVHRLIQMHQGPPWVAWHHDFAWLRPQYQPEMHPGDPWALLKQPWPGVKHVTVSHAQQQDLARLYNLPLGEIAVVWPGVEPDEFYRLPQRVADLVRRWRLFQADCVFLLPARITRRKNIELGLQWLAEVRQQSGRDARLIVTGPPSLHNPTNPVYYNNLLTMRQTLKLEKAAHFVYEVSPSPTSPLFLDDAELAACYQLADAMLFPSRQEGFGIPILEAGLARLPIFATDLPPFRESAATYACLFALDAPPAAVASTIIETLQSNQAFQLRRRMLSHFTWQRIVEDKILPLLQQAVVQATAAQKDKDRL